MEIVSKTEITQQLLFRCPVQKRHYICLMLICASKGKGINANVGGHNNSNHRSKFWDQPQFRGLSQYGKHYKWIGGRNAIHHRTRPSISIFLESAGDNRLVLPDVRDLEGAVFPHLKMAVVHNNHNMTDDQKLL